VTSSAVKKIKTTYTPNELLRVSIAEKAMQGNVEEAQAEYDQAIAKDSSFIADARTLHTLATNLIKQGELAQGILLFEQYLAHYKQAKDRGEVALLLAAKYIRVLGNKKRGKKLLQEYSASFPPEHAQLANTLTKEANT
jgi:Tfp pilus assembly protein PilF